METFKVGDNVEFIRPDFASQGQGAEIGTKAVVSELIGLGISGCRVKFKLDNQTKQISVYNEEIQLVQPQPKVKVGDIVIIMNTHEHFFALGSEAVVVKDLGNGKISATGKSRTGGYRTNQILKPINYRLKTQKEDSNMSQFTKKNLKSGMLVVRRDGAKRLVYRTSMGNLFLASETDNGSLPLSDYSDELTHHGDAQKDIVVVYSRPNEATFLLTNLTPRRRVWERPAPKPAPKEMTVAEIAQALGHDVKIVK